MKLTTQQRAELSDAGAALQTAKGHLELAQTLVPVTGDAELHCLRLEIQHLISRVASASFNAGERAKEE